MTELELQRKIAFLESINDQLYAEVRYLDGLMRSVGFSNGIQTVKDTAQEILSKDGHYYWEDSK